MNLQGLELEDEDPTGLDIEFDPTVQRMSGTTAHGYIDFDVPFITEIAGNLWQGGCQDGLVLPKTFKHLVSLYKWESYDVEHDLDSRMTIKAYDSLDQAMGQIDAVAFWVSEARKTGPVLVHCQAGLNRSSLVVARALMFEGMTADDAISLIREKRSPAALCNPAFETWLRHQ